MKIDEKRLDELKQEIREWAKTITNERVGDTIELHPGEGHELIRLARLGLWAEKHAVPAVHEAAAIHECQELPVPKSIRDALAALPKENQS